MCVPRMLVGVLPNPLHVVRHVESDDIFMLHQSKCRFPWWLSGKEAACNAGDVHSLPGLGRSLGKGSSQSLQDFCLENPTEREAWWATVHGVTKSRTQPSDCGGDLAGQGLVS